MVICRGWLISSPLGSSGTNSPWEMLFLLYWLYKEAGHLDFKQLTVIRRQGPFYDQLWSLHPCFQALTNGRQWGDLSSKNHLPLPFPSPKGGSSSVLGPQIPAVAVSGNILQAGMKTIAVTAYQLQIVHSPQQKQHCQLKQFYWKPHSPSVFLKACECWG